jgi:hypothetical protein
MFLNDDSASERIAIGIERSKKKNRSLRRGLIQQSGNLVRNDWRMESELDTIFSYSIQALQIGCQFEFHDITIWEIILHLLCITLPISKHRAYLSLVMIVKIQNRRSNFRPI